MNKNIGYVSKMKQVDKKPNPLVDQSKELAEMAKGIRDELFNKKEFDIGRQFYRSATSIGANISEGQSPQSDKDFISKLKIAHKEALETNYWLKEIEETLSKGECQKFSKKLRSVTYMLNMSIATAVRNSKNKNPKNQKRKI
jgi:four helix bundle protein